MQGSYMTLALAANTSFKGSTSSRVESALFAAPGRLSSPSCSRPLFLVSNCGRHPGVRARYPSALVLLPQHTGVTTLWLPPPARGIATPALPTCCPG